MTKASFTEHQLRSSVRYAPRPRRFTPFQIVRFACFVMILIAITAGGLAWAASK